MKRLTVFLTLLALTLTVSAASYLISTTVVGNTSRVASRLVSARPCSLYAVMGYNAQTNSQFVYVFESKVAPTNGQAGRLGPFPVGAAQYYSIDLSAYGAYLDAVYVGVSTSDLLYTNSATNCTIQAIIAGGQ